MMILRRANERGHAGHGWLNSYHSFSFAGYHDANHMGYGPLRVINEDRITPGAGFGTHGHRDMEIISYVLDGELAHRDNMGNGSVIRPGDVQRMSAGRGVQHSEYNHAQEVTHFLQIWIEPNVQGIAPGYEEKHFNAAQKRGRLTLVAAPAGSPEADAHTAVTIHQNARIYAGLIDGSETAQLALTPGRRTYVHVARGAVTVNGSALEAGDATKLSGEGSLTLTQGLDAEVLVFDLP